MMNGTKKLQNVPAAGKDALISKNLLKSFEDELGDDFLSWKPSRSSATPTLDFDDGLPSKLSQKSFKMDKLDMDFDFDAGFTTNLASFDIDLDFPESPMPRNITRSDSEDFQSMCAPKRKEREVRTKSLVPDDTFTYKSQGRHLSGDTSRDPDDTSAFRNEKRPEREAKTLDSGANLMKRQERAASIKSIDFDDTCSWRSKGDAVSLLSKELREPADVHNQSDDEATSYGQLTSSDMQTAEAIDKQQKRTHIGQVLLACRNGEQKKQDLSATANLSSERRVAEENAQMNKGNDDFDKRNENGSKHNISESSLQKVLRENNKLRRCDPGTEAQKDAHIQPSTKNSSPVGGKDAERALLTSKGDEEELPNALEDPGSPERRRSKDSFKSRVRSSQDGARTSKSKQKLPVPVKKTNDRNCTESATKQPAKDQHNVRSQHGVRTLASAMNSPSMVKQKNYVQPLHTYSGLAARHGSVLGEKRINLSAALKNSVPTQVSALKTLRSLPLPPFNAEQTKGAPVKNEAEIAKERISPDTPKVLEGSNITVEGNQLVKGQPQRPAERNERESLKYPPGLSDAKTSSLSPAVTKMKSSLLIPKSRNSRKHPAALFSLPLCKLIASDKPEPSQAPLKTLQKPEMSVLTIKPLGVRPGEATEAHEGQSHKHKTINQTALVRDNLHDIRYMHLNDEHDRTPVLLLKDTADYTTPVIIDESTDLAQTAEDYSIELDSVLKVLKQRSEAAKDLLARAVIHNVQKSLLLSPIYEEKMDRLQNQIQEKLRDLVTVNTTTNMTQASE